MHASSVLKCDLDRVGRKLSAKVLVLAKQEQGPGMQPEGLRE
jgi:hypothetical protein